MSNQMSKLFLTAIILFFILACSVFPVTKLENSIPITSVQLSELDPDSYIKIGLGRVYNTKYSPDNKILAVATSTGVLLYNATTYELIKHFPDGFVDNLEWSPDRSKLAYSEVDKTL
jgi:WD40 repeat protein